MDGGHNNLKHKMEEEWKARMIKHGGVSCEKSKSCPLIQQQPQVNQVLQALFCLEDGMNSCPAMQNFPRSS